MLNGLARFRQPLPVAGAAPAPRFGSRLARQVSRGVLGASAGMMASSGLGLLLGAVVGIIEFRELALGSALSGAIFGLGVGASCGLPIGLAAVLLRRPWAGLLLGAAWAALLGGLMGAACSAAIPQPIAPVWIGGMAGGIGGCLVARIIQRMKRRWAVQAEAAGVAQAPSLEGCDAPALPALPPAVCSLQDGIQRAGRVTLSLRFMLPLSVSALLFGGYVVMSGGWWSFVPLFWPYISALICLGFLVGLPISYPLAALYRRARREQLRRELAGLPVEERSQVFAVLVDPTRPEAFEFAAPLLREFRDEAASELVPAAAPAGRGDEPSPAGCTLHAQEEAD
jgi:hypothetical protein